MSTNLGSMGSMDPLGRESDDPTIYLPIVTNSPDLPDPTLTMDINKLSAAVLAMCKKRGWCLKWTSRGVYLHLEVSELIEALRGKGREARSASDAECHPSTIERARKTDIENEGADVLLVLLSILANEGIHFSDIIARTWEVVTDLKTRPRYVGEEVG